MPFQMWCRCIWLRPQTMFASMVSLLTVFLPCAAKMLVCFWNHSFWLKQTLSHLTVDSGFTTLCLPSPSSNEIEGLPSFLCSALAPFLYSLGTVYCHPHTSVGGLLLLCRDLVCAVQLLGVGTVLVVWPCNTVRMGDIGKPWGIPFTTWPIVPCFPSIQPWSFGWLSVLQIRKFI